LKLRGVLKRSIEDFEIFSFSIPHFRFQFVIAGAARAQLRMTNVIWKMVNEIGPAGFPLSARANFKRAIPSGAMAARMRYAVMNLFVTTRLFSEEV
jgi:hypothetical protein